MAVKPIDFAGLAAELLSRAGTLVPQWLPAGKEQAGRWYIGDLEGTPGKSCNVDLRTGTWIDNGTDEKGGDLISLYAAIHGLNNGQAAQELMREVGWSAEQTPPPRRVQTSAPAPRRAADEGAEPAPADGGGPRKSNWVPIVPAPKNAPPAKFSHFHHGPASAVWTYRRDEDLFGYVCRFDKAPKEDGKARKEVLPLTWCVDTGDDRGTRRWHWKQWDEPRPLYLPTGQLSDDPALPVLLVEGEKCADAGQAVLPGEYEFVSWPGGCRTWAMADWSWIKGRTVYLWADCDAQRARLSREEREAGVDPNSKPLIPEAKQPGVATMNSIGTLLSTEFECTVHWCPVPKPGAMSEGWDLADAIAGGWDAEQVRAFIRGARPFRAPDDEARANANAPEARRLAGAGEDRSGRAWRQLLISSSTGALKSVRENVVLCMDGTNEVGGTPELQGVVGFNEFTNDVIKLKDAPWGSPAGVWAEVDELLLGEYLVHEHSLPSMPRGTLEEAVAMVAHRHRYHPIREWLGTLKWDGQPRLATWIRRVCLEEDEWDDRDPLQRYLARVGTWYLQAMCARAMRPGVKFDYMLILEGTQGLRKSTTLRTLAGDWFADTGLVLGDKDSYQQLQGVWLYEIPELDAFSKADVMKIKAYIASQEDYFRASFDRRARKYPRQLVFGGTTNEDHYLTDPTGSRRFWPVRVTRICDIDWLEENREQLFAEAMDRVNRDARMWPTPDEERELFVPQQQQRAVENAIESAIARYLDSNADGQLLNEVSLVEILSKIGIGIEKLGPGRFHEKQASAALKRLNWIEGRSSHGSRPRVYRRPTAPAKPGASATNQQPTQGNDDGDPNACPF